MTELRTVSVPEAREAIRRWFRGGLEAMDPYAATRGVIARDPEGLRLGDEVIPIADGATLVALAVGKAAAPMARAIEDVAGDLLDRRILLTKDGHLAGSPVGWTAYEAAHPVPDARGEHATDDILDALSGLGPDDVVLVLVSGGGSALLESPRPPLKLDDIRRVTDLMLRAGAPIQDLNAVRRELSQVKGGGLRRRMGDARCVSLILSDVLGNDPETIASGPTITRKPTPERALALIDHYGLAGDVGSDVLEVIASGGNRDQSGSSRRADRYVVVADNEDLIETVARLASAEGRHVVRAMEGSEGEASELAEEFVQLLENQPEDIEVVVGGGEGTVTVRGEGRGGRNTEFALAAARALRSRSLDWVVASLASDGQDGSIDAAGAIVDRETTARGDSRGLASSRALRENDSGGYLESLGELEIPGPTGTNVNDVYIAVRASALRS